jgi:twinkle protein
LPCPCGKSSDGYSENDDGSGHCFVCNEHYPRKATNGSGGVVDRNFRLEHREWRGLTSRTMEKYGIVFKVDTETGVPVNVAFPYSDDGTWKVREPIDAKEFRVVNGKTNFRDCLLFGQSSFNASGSDSITITEGELDAASVWQMVGHPAVSLKSGASGAKRDCQRAFKYLDSFKRVILCFDGDAIGERAVREVAPLFDNRKLYIVKLTKHKDANDFLQSGDIQEFKNAWHNARRYVPDGVISSFNEVADILREGPKKSDASYPFDELQAKTYGLRSGEVVLVTAQEGVGKTEFLRWMEHHILKTTEANIGTIRLEESRKRTIHGLLKYEFQAPVHLEDTHISIEEQIDAYQNLLKREDRLYIFSHYGSDDPDAILGVIRFLVAVCDCKFVFLDHLSMVVDGNLEVDERKVLDYLSTKLSEMTRELDFCLVVVSHINDEGQTRGSRLISKLASVHIRLERDPLDTSSVARNKTDVIVLKNREIGDAGPSGTIFFDNVTHTLRPFVTEDETV